MQAIYARHELCSKLYIYISWVSKAIRDIKIGRLLRSTALDEPVVAWSSSVGNQSSVVTITVEDNTIGSRLSTSVDLEGWENWVFVPRAGYGEVEAFIVVVLVWVVIVGLAGLQKGVSLVQGGIDVRLPVACVATVFDARVALLRRGSSVDAGDKEKGGGGDLYGDEISICVWLTFYLHYFGISWTHLGELHLCEFLENYWCFLLFREAIGRRVMIAF